jgi:DNA-binding NtrC family response regulator
MTEQTYPVFLVDDNEVALTYYRTVLEYHGVKNLVSCQDSREVLSRLEEKGSSLILLDLNMPYITGRELLEKIKPNHPDIPVIVITSEDVVQTAVECIKLGAFDYLIKPVEKNRLWAVVRHALDMGNLQREVQQLSRQILSQELKNPEAFSAIITAHDSMKSIFKYIEAVAVSPKPVLITGESGTGKELIARVIYKLSRKEDPFVSVNVSGLDDTMFSDTLFGHSKGAYTGAESERMGLVDRASGGTLFLDEIGDLEQSSQIKLLRLLQEEEYYPLGSDKIQKSNARIITATNSDLKTKQTRGTFRKDLYYRLIAHHIAIPPLRERMQDLPLLVDHFLEQASVSMKRKRPTVPRELYTLLGTYPFPGNVRELQSLIFDAVSRHEKGVLSLAPFKRYMNDQQSQSPHEPPAQVAASSTISYTGGFPTLHEVEAFFISEALKKTGGNQSVAARLLGVNQSTLSRRLKKDEGNPDMGSPL